MMEFIKENIYKWVLLFCFLVLSVTAFSAQTAFAAPVSNPLTLDVAQSFIVEDGEAPTSSFTYRMTAKTPATPMPPGTVGDAYTFSIDGTDNTTLGPIDFIQAGTYSYEIAQVIDTPAEGYVYDEEVYSLSVKVDAGLNADIILRKSNGAKAEAIQFENRFMLRPSDPSVMVDPPVKKTVIGNPDKKGTFTFKLEARDKTSPMPSGSEDGVKLMTIIGPGEEDFGTWSYMKSGIYYYTISEVDNSEERYTYDTQIYTITDNVKNENGQLVVTRTVTNAFNKPVDNFTFINHYDDSDGGSAVDSGTDTVDGTGSKTTGKGTSGGKGITGPKTGDDTNLLSLIITLGIAACVGTCCVAYLLHNKRKKEACAAVLDKA